jgi:hypothetical protein
LFIDDIINNLVPIKGLSLEDFNLLKERLKNVTVFEVTNVREYVTNTKHKPDIKELPCLIPPFQFCWFEWKYPSDSHEVFYRFGALIERRELENSEWGVSGAIFNQFVNGLTLHSGYEYAVLDKSGKMIVSDGRNRIMGNKEITNSMQKANNLGIEKNIEELRYLIEISFHTSMLAISFLHCKNTRTVDFNHSEKLQKNRLKKNKFPLMNYKTLEILPMHRFASSRKDKTESLEYSLHICRGHFKDFRNGNGLFGKYKDIYWWDSMVRGKKEQGEVIKDYKIDLNKQDRRTTRFENSETHSV